MSGWTSAGSDSEDAANGAGRPGRTAAATNGAATTGTGGATEDKAEPPLAAADASAPPRAGGPPGEEEPEAMVPPDGPTPPCPAIHAPGPVEGTLPSHGNYKKT